MTLEFLPFAAAQHLEAVRALFRSNVPAYFAAPEEPDLLAYLRSGQPYFVAREASAARPVAAGGYALNRDRVVLTWGLVHAAHHRQGIGRRFTEFRLAKAAAHYPGLPIEIETSQHTAPFYEQLGFRLLRIHLNYWAPELHLYHMQLRAAPEQIISRA